MVEVRQTDLFKDWFAGLSDDYGPGYRVYFVRRRAEVVILLCGGDKRTQERDISRAKLLAAEL